MAKKGKLLRNISLIALALVITLLPAVSVIAEEITLTTIMPGQDTLRVKRGAVGDDYRKTTTHPDSAIGDDNLIIEGKVGIGMDNPQSELHIGEIEASSGVAGSVSRLMINPYSNTGGPYEFIARTLSTSEDYLDLKYGSVNLISFGGVSGIVSLPKQSGARAYRSVDQNVPTNTWTKVQLNAETYDIQNEFSTASNRFTAKEAGYYLVIGSSCWFPSVSHRRYYVSIYKNGAAIAYHTEFGETNLDVFCSASDVVYLDGVNDYVELWVNQFEGDNGVLIGGGAYTFLTVAKIK